MSSFKEKFADWFSGGSSGSSGSTNPYAVLAGVQKGGSRLAGEDLAQPVDWRSLLTPSEQATLLGSGALDASTFYRNAMNNLTNVVGRRGLEGSSYMPSMQAGVQQAYHDQLADSQAELIQYLWNIGQQQRLSNINAANALFGHESAKMGASSGGGGGWGQILGTALGMLATS